MPNALPFRSNPTLWLSPLVAAGIFYMWFSVQAPVVPDPYWTAYLARSADGLQYGLPFGAAAAAWAAWRQRRLASAIRGTTRNAVRVYWSHLWPIYAAVATGLGAGVVGQTSLQRPTQSAPDLRILIVFAAMTFVATAIGWLTGTVLPLPLALPVALFVAFEWAVYPLADGSDVSYRNMTGYALFGCCDSAAYELTPRALIAPVIVMIGMIVAVYFAIRWEGRVRWVTVGVPALAIAVATANVISTGTAAFGQQWRDASTEECVGAEPTVCMFPEVASARHRVAMRQTIAGSYANAAAAGITLPAHVVMTGRYPVNRTGVTFVNLSGGLSSRQILQVYADGIYSSLQCSAELPPDPRVPPGTDVVFALAVVLGLDLEAATPQISIGGEEGGSAGTDLSPAATRQLLKVTSSGGALELAKRWVNQQTACARGEG